jgi:CheY-like chemotaxis protein
MSRPAVLVVEDNEDIQSTFRLLCELEGFEVWQAGNGQDALALLRQRGKKPSVIFLDLMMPVMDGHKFHMILTTDPNFRQYAAPVYVVSAARDKVPPDIQGFLKKPVDLEAIVDVLDLFRGPPDLSTGS